MSKQIEDGGAAFPVNGFENPNHGWQLGQDGMTLRDYFAGEALNGQLATDQGYSAEARKIASWSYELADAMIKARKETES